MAGFGNRRKTLRSPEQHQVELEQEENLSGLTTTRVAIGFCIAGLLGALFLTPVLDNGARSLKVASHAVFPNTVDRTITGSVEKAKKARRYTIRRSVMQKNPAAPCYIFEDGSREGDC